MENKPVPRFINPSYHDEIRKDYTGLVQRIRTAMDDKGLAVLENFIDPGFLAQMRNGVD